MKFTLIEDYLTEDLEAAHKKYPKIPSETFYEIIAYDPTFKESSDKLGKYGRWILDKFNKGTLEKSKDLIMSTLRRFDDSKNDLKDKDIGKFKNASEVVDFLNDPSNYKEETANRKAKKNKKKANLVSLVDGADLLYEDDEWQIYTPKSYEAEVKLGQLGTFANWCTSSTSGDTYYKHYLKNYGGKYYVNINKNDPKKKCQFHFESNQFMDINDDEIDLKDFISKYPRIYEFYKSIGFDMKKYGDFAVSNLLDACGFTDDNIEEKIEIEISNEDFAKQFTDDSCSSLDKDILYNVFSNKWDSYDLIDEFNLLNNYNVNDFIESISDYNKEKIEKAGVTFNKDSLKHNNDVINAIIQAGVETEAECTFYNIRDSIWKSINSIFSITEMYGDDSMAFNESLESVVSWRYSTSIDEYIMDNIIEFGYENEIEKSRTGLIKFCMLNEIKDNLDIIEPYFGWVDWDNDMFNDILDYKLDEIS